MLAGERCHFDSMDGVQVDSAARKINDLTERGARPARDHAFRVARRHTGLVRVLRIVLPVVAIGLLASYSLFVRQSYKIQTAGKGEITFGTVSFSTEALKAFDPKYEGFNADGGRYTVIARSAEQDFRQTGPIKLDAITGRLTEVNNSVTRLKAVRGDYFDKSGVLELFERIDVDGDNGLKALMTRATVKTKESRIETSEPVVVDMPGTNIRSKRMVIEQKKRTVLFSDDVKTRLTQDQSKPRPATRTDSPTGLAPGDGPIDIASQQLAVDDVAKVALFSGNVVAKQGVATLTTPELEVLYEEPQGQKPAGEAGPQAQPPPASSASSASRVKLIRAKRDVVMVNGTQRATGSSADFDQREDTMRLHGPVEITQEPDRRATGDEAFVDNRNDTILLTGTVVVTQARNMLRGRRMLVNRKASTMQMTSPADASGAAGRVFARLYSADADAAGQPAGAAAKRRSATPQPQPAAKDPSALFAAQRDPNQPIDVDAASLDVDDMKKVAIFRGNVVAVQGDYTVRTPELAAMYTGDSTIGFGTSAAAPAAGDKKPSSELRRVEARQRVAITTKDGQSATGSFAEFDPKTNTATITGDVILTRGDSVTRGNRATMDMTTGKFAMVEAPQASAPAGAAAGTGAAVTKVRPTLLIYPDKAREASKDAKAAAEKKGAASPAAAPAASKASPPASSSAASPPAAASKARASGWSSTVDSPVDRQ